MKKLFTLFLITASFYSFAQWQSANGPFGGYTGSVIISGSRLISGSSTKNIYYSDNKGLGWIKTSSGIPDSITRIKGFASNDGVLLAGAYRSGIYKSTDNGSTWSLFSNTMGNMRIEDIAFKGSEIWIVGEGVMKSTDNGLTWARVTSPEGSSYLSSNISVIDSILYLNAFMGGLIRISDNGRSWNTVSAGSFSNVISADNELYTVKSGDVLVRSQNNGLSWDSVRTLPVNGSVCQLQYADNTLYAATHAGPVADGIYKSTDLGNTMVPINNGLFADDVSSFAHFKNRLYAITSSSGVSSTDNQFNTWKKEYLYPLYNEGVYSLTSTVYKNGLWLHSGTSRSGIAFPLYTTDGTTWQHLPVPLPQVALSSPRISIVAKLYLPVNDTLISVLDSSESFNLSRKLQFFISTDNGASWKKSVKIDSLEFYEQKAAGNKIIYLGRKNSKWFFVEINHLSGTFKFHPADSIFPAFGSGSRFSPYNYHFAAIENTYFISTAEGLARSTGFEQWSIISPVPGEVVNTILTGNGVLYAAIENRGVMYSSDLGDTWQELDMAQVEDNISSLFFKGDTLFAGTTNSGVFYYAGAPLAVDEITEKAEAQPTVWPNPFEKDICLNTGKGTSEGFLEVTDITGNVVYSHKGGNNSRTDLTFLQKGVYILRYTSPQQTFTRKIEKL